MKRLIPLAAAFALALTGTAQAHGFPITIIRTTTITDPHARKAEELQPATCPAGVPVQTITVVNDAHAPAKVLKRVERASVDQSIQLRAAWQTPCVQFGAGGWILHLIASPPVHNADGSTSMTIAGHHETGGVIYVDTGTNPMSLWSRAWTHEVDETLVDPDLTNRYALGLREVCDPVENITYPLDGIQVSDFVYPNSYVAGSGAPWDQAGAQTGPITEP